MAGDRGRARPARLDLPRDALRPLVRGRDLASARERGLPVVLDHAKGVEAPRDRRAVVERAERTADPFERLRLAHPLERRDLALDEAGDEPAFGLDEVDDLRPDPERSRRPGRAQLDGAVDAEQVRVLPCHTQHVGLAVELDLDVVVRDPAAERLEPRTAAGPDALDRAGEVRHARILAPAGS